MIPKLPYIWLEPRTTQSMTMTEVRVTQGVTSRLA